MCFKQTVKYLSILLIYILVCFLIVETQFTIPEKFDVKVPEQKVSVDNPEGRERYLKIWNILSERHIHADRIVGKKDKCKNAEELIALLKDPHTGVYGCGISNGDNSDVSEIKFFEKEKVCLIKLKNFMANSDKYLRKDLVKFCASDCSVLILDLRGNPGGYVEMVEKISGFFIQGQKIVCFMKDNKGNTYTLLNEVNHVALDVFGEGRANKIIILTDSLTASASEMLCATLSRYGLCMTIGQKTYGKFTAQIIEQIDRGVYLKFTHRYWVTPTMRTIEGGIRPDIEVPVSTPDEDFALQKSFDFISKIPRPPSQ
jgi:hypothetical protein